jgi:D-alanine-D-alanine ligase
MRIGLTYDLRSDYLAAGYSEEDTAEFDRGETIDAIEEALRTLGHRTDRVGNVHALVERLAAGDRWDLVFNIAEGLEGFGRESQVPALLEAYGIAYTFSDPLVAALTLHKGMAKHVLLNLGLPTTPFREVARPADVDAVDLPFPLFVKPIAEGTAKGIDGRSRVRSPDELRTACLRILERYRQPALVEPFLSGREFTVGITGTGDQALAVGTMEILLLADAEPHSYTYINKERSEELCDLPLAPEPWASQAADIALRAWRGLGCRDAGRIDLRADDAGTLHLLEINPLPGLHPTHSDLPVICAGRGVPFVDLIGRIVASASARISHRRSRPGPLRPAPAGAGAAR